MKKLKCLIMLIISIPILSGCSQLFDTAVYPEDFSDEELYSMKEKANESFLSAHDDFIAEIEEVSIYNSTTRSITNNNEELEIPLKDSIISAAWEAYYTDDLTDLNKLLEENGLNDKLQIIIDKYDLSEQQKILNMKSKRLKYGLTGSDTVSRKVSESFFNNSNFLDGDIFLSYKISGSSSFLPVGLLIPGHWKHSGIYAKTKPFSSNKSYSILSASNKTSHGFAVGYESRIKWSEEDAVAALRVRGRTNAKALAAVDYGSQFVGREFSFSASRTSNDTWYCSKVVYRSWLSQGINLEPKIGFFDFHVTPQNIWDDSDTYWIAGDKW